MPWQETKPMDQKILFIADYLRDTYSHTELCVRYGISRKTGYKWLARYQQYELESAGKVQRMRPEDIYTLIFDAAPAIALVMMWFFLKLFGKGDY